MIRRSTVTQSLSRRCSRTALRRWLSGVPRASIGSTVLLVVIGVTFGLGFTAGIDHPYDKLVHGVFFALLTVSLSGFFGGRILPALALAVLIGGGGELAQALLPHREASLLDMAANLVGALSAASVMALLPSGAALLPWRELGFTEVADAPVPVPVSRQDRPRGR